MNLDIRIKRVVQLVGMILLVLLFIKSAWVLVFLQDGKNLTLGRAREDLLNRRAYLVSKVFDQNAGVQDMPTSLPDLFQGEWAVVTYSMTTVALANMAFDFPETRQESLKVVSAMIRRMLDQKFRSFDTGMWGEDALKTLGSTRGHIGFLGHLNLMLAAHVYLGGVEYEGLFHSTSQALIGKIEASPIFAPETYPGEIYIPDNLVVVASLALYERWCGLSQNRLSEKWVEHSKKKFVDPATGLLAFSLHQQGQILEGARGSGTGWNCFYLSFIDVGFSYQQYSLMKKNFKKKLWFGITGITEWPGGGGGVGDVDSGPLVFGLSPSGTGFAISGAKFHNDVEFLDSLLLTSEIAGFTFQMRKKRRYLAAPLVGDAIVLAMKSITKWDKRFLNEKQ